MAMECSGFSWVLIALSLSHSLPLALTLNYNVLKSRQCEFESFVILVAMVTTPAFCGACVVVVVLSVSGVEGCAEPCWSAISQNPASHMQPHALVLFGLFFFFLLCLHCKVWQEAPAVVGLCRDNHVSFNLFSQYCITSGPFINNYWYLFICLFK